MDNKTFKCREDIPLRDRWATEDLYAGPPRICMPAMNCGRRSWSGWFR